jgi:tetrapyrrole methylase family protein/MazG family protein
VVALDPVWAALGVDPVAEGVTIVDASVAERAAGAAGPFLVAGVDDERALRTVRGLLGGGGAGEVVVLQRLGFPDARVEATTWDRLTIEPDPSTYLYVARRADVVGAGYVRFHELVRTLRAECPWDRQQTHATLVPYLVEETFELVDALAGLDPAEPASYAAVVEELGDVLFQIEFHAVVGEQEGRFTIDDVAAGIHDKLVRRHPHVFAGAAAEDAATVVRNWDEIKRAEKVRASVFEGVPTSLPGLAYGQQLMRKAAKLGFDWPDVGGPLAKLEEELAELRAALGAGAGPPDQAAVADELGDVLVTVVSVARHVGVDAEVAMRAAAGKFRRRFEAVEVLAAERGVDVAGADLATLDALWDAVKSTELR